MATHSEVSKPTPTIQPRNINRSVLLFAGLAVIAALLLLGIASTFMAPQAVTLNRAQTALAERYQGLAGYYTRNEPMSVEAVDAWTARYEGLAKSMMSSSAMTARYQGLADSFAADNAWSARYQGLADAQPVPVGANLAWADRYQGLAGMYIPAEPMPARASDAWAARYSGLAAALTPEK